jgi:hypothetical protein
VSEEDKIEEEIKQDKKEGESKDQAPLALSFEMMYQLSEGEKDTKVKELNLKIERMKLELLEARFKARQYELSSMIQRAEEEFEKSLARHKVAIAKIEADLGIRLNEYGYKENGVLVLLP